MLVSFNNVSFGVAGKKLLDRANLTIHNNEIISLIGRNGSGKTTIMKLLSQELSPDEGKISFQKNLQCGYVPQLIPEFSETVYAVVSLAFPVMRDTFMRYFFALSKNCADSALLASLNAEINEKDAWDDFVKIEKALSYTQLDGTLSYSNLSVGQKRRCIIAKALALDPDILLLDEPTNHLDMPSILWLEEFLKSYKKTVFLVTHDRHFLAAVTDSIYELDRGTLRAWNCSYDTYLQRKEAWLEQEEIKHRELDKKLAEEEAWLRKGIRARRTRNEGRVRALPKLRSEKEQRQLIPETASFSAQTATTNSKKLISLKNISFGYSEEMLISDFSLELMRGDKVALLGTNGCGKTTLIKILLKELEVQSGTVVYAENVKAAYFDQTRLQLDENMSIFDNISDGSDTVFFNGKARHIFSYLQDFLFEKDQLTMPVSALSGGEKNRLMLAKLFCLPANLLILDEPTNDLDMETLELLESILVEYNGTIVLVSHDRSFVDNVATTSVFFTQEARLIERVGGYEHWSILMNTLEEKQASSKQKKIINETEKKIFKQKRKLTYKEKKELENLPVIIDELEQHKIEFEKNLAEADFFKQNSEHIKAVQRQYEELVQTLDKHYLRWDSLEEKFATCT